MKKIFNAKGLVRAMLISIIFIAVALVVNNLYAQKKDNGDPPKNNKNEPKVTIKVNKKRDKNGNIVQYDSSYISSWSSNGTMPADADSMMKSMHEHFFSRLHSQKPDSLNMPFGFDFGTLNDSDFFDHNFNNMLGDNFGDWDKLFKDHQKMMQKFYNQEPMLKIPDDATPPPVAPQKPKKQENSLKKQKIKDPVYSVDI